MLLAGTLAGCLRLLHLFRHLRFHSVKVEARAALHWRIIQEGLELLAHYLLHEDKAPELELEPIEVLLPTFFGPIVWPALALERIETQVDQVRHIRFSLFTKPTLRLTDEPVLVVVNAHRTDRAFAEVEDLVTRGLISLASDKIQLVIAVQIGFVRHASQFYALK